MAIDPAQMPKINEAYDIIQAAFKAKKLIYGVNANFGAMAVHPIAILGKIISNDL